jgi:hypothetical protein
MTSTHDTPLGPCIERKIGCGSYTAVHRTYPMHIAAVQAVREQHSIGEGILPWIGGAGGRFARKAVA